MDGVFEQPVGIAGLKAFSPPGLAIGVAATFHQHQAQGVMRRRLQVKQREPKLHLCNPTKNI